VFPIQGIQRRGTSLGWCLAEGFESEISATPTGSGPWTTFLFLLTRHFPGKPGLASFHLIFSFQ